MKKSFKQLLTIQIFMLLVIITGFFSGTIFKSNLKVLFLFISFYLANSLYISSSDLAVLRQEYC